MAVFQARVIEATASPYEDAPTLWTLELIYPRFVHSELMTHRVFSRNASSSRAIPTSRLIAAVREQPATPIHWGVNRPGMQATEELTGDALAMARALWLSSARAAVDHAEQLAALGLHKQVVNRILEPFQHMRTIITGADWDNFFALRIHPDAQPEMRALAVAIRDAMMGYRYSDETSIRVADTDTKHASGWHLPYITAAEREVYAYDPVFLCKLSAARCARVSYLKHDGTLPSHEDDLKLFDKLAGSSPIHASPLEHQAAPLDGTKTAGLSGNLRGWAQFRKLWEAELVQ